MTFEVIVLRTWADYRLAMVTATMPVMSISHAPVGELLRRWRERRRLSQLALAAEADVSARHVSFLENGRSRPSREMLLRLAEHLEIPLRERNALLVAAGYAPAFPERRLDDPALQAARQAVELVLARHKPYPALGDEGTEAPRRDLYESGVVVPLRLRTEWGMLAFFSTITIFGSPVDVTLSELAVEAFFPADPATAEALRPRRGGARSPRPLPITAS